MQAEKTVTLPYDFMSGLYNLISNKLNVVTGLTQGAFDKINLAKEKGKMLDKDEVIKIYETALEKIQKRVFEEAVPQFRNSHNEMIKIATVNPVKN